ncbi:TetR/AcrR family transcriptional regulator [Dysosmobacter sp.]|uniref:TetR/AcrR family transcriptional regulator n=1 Tax=Dysosmobacter sp. TaxID=2591382 RepID=UPI002A878EE1|nr:TetR/AcrR family transcriptional regulator C-terminal domain-containing protein [Dysosmobacter sp.]MDY3282501.1 TetR/AcrR family transcriptional regulator C-terminal domain-containing protein [Dysosmobacter sp.]
MSSLNRTKDAIADAFLELLTERPLSKITVKDIVDRCGINRNTFYYHFEGIPSLLEQTVRYMSDQIIQAHSRFGSPMDCIAPFVQYCTDNKKAILHIYRSVQREVFLTYLDRAAMYTVSRYVEATTADLLPSESHAAEKNLLIRYYKCTLVGALLDWLDTGMDYDLLAAAQGICELLAGSGKQAFLKCLETK